MIATVIVDKKEEECRTLHALSKDALSRISDEKLEFRRWSGSEIEDQTKADGLTPDAAMIEILSDTGRMQAGRIRSLYKESELMIISDLSVSPMQYLNPSIRAASLLLRPYSGDTAKSVVTDFYASIMAKRESSREECFVIENQDGKQLIPYSDIYYFEVNGKKIHARTRNRILSRYGTLDQLEPSLPSQFMRCHRSYIVNMDRFVKVRITDGLLFLTDEVTVPLSRSYKPAIKEFLDAAKR